MDKRNLKIAIVDDHIDTVTSISNYLEGNGLKTIWAYNGDDAITLCNVQKPDLLILDIKMAGKSGFDVAKVLSKQKILFITGDSDLAARAEKLSNCIGVVMKPVDLDEIVHKILREFDVG